MQTQFNILQVTRNNIKTIISKLNLKQLNTIPTGFNNSIAWQLGHVIATQQLLCYGLTSSNFTIKESLIDKYRKGSFPQEINQDELDELLNLLTVTSKKLALDYTNELFKTFSTYETSFGFTLNTIEEAIIMNNVHEGLHLGNIMALNKLI